MARATAAASPLLTRSLRLLVPITIENPNSLDALFPGSAGVSPALPRRTPRSNRAGETPALPGKSASQLRASALNLSQNFASDDDPLNLRRPFSDRAELRI